MNLWNELFRIRDEQREQLKKSKIVIKYNEIPWEENRHGKMKWYLHPALKDAALRTLNVYLQEIPPGGRTGKVAGPGSLAFYFWEGTGYTIVGGYGKERRCDWEATDVLLLPPAPTEPYTYQHFNSDSARPARLLCVSHNLTDLLGVDMGVGFEQLENAPGPT